MDLDYTAHEEWGHVHLRDGTRIRLKATLAFLWEEAPRQLRLKSATVVAAQVPPDQRRLPAKDREPVDRKEWADVKPSRGIYVASNGITIILRGVPTEVFRLARATADGEPVFEVLSEVEIQVQGPTGAKAEEAPGAPGKGRAVLRR